MFVIEKISKVIATEISSNLRLDKDSEEIIAYGAFTFLQILWSIFLVIVFGLFFSVQIESLVVLGAISCLRKYSGGVHSASPNRCAVIGTILSIGIAVISVRITKMDIFSAIMVAEIVGFIIAYSIVCKLAPVDSPAKPIVKLETRKRLRKRSIQVLHSHSIVALILVVIHYYFNYKNLLAYSVCICIATVWQAFTLTYKGHLVMERIDTFLGNISTLKGGLKG
jgi:accessory gene regulator B